VWESQEDFSGKGTDQGIFISRSVDNGTTWTAPSLLNINATTGSTVGISPQVATDGAGNWISVCYSREELSGAGTDTDIFVARATANFPVACLFWSKFHGVSPVFVACWTNLPFPQ